MADPSFVDRLAALPQLAKIPRQELEWLVAHGNYEVREAGYVIAEKGQPVHYLWVLLHGSISVHVDRGAGPRRVMGWQTGDVSGMLPYSRMTGPPGHNVVEERSELLTVPVADFPEMVHLCPTFTSHTVHLMLDRARNFNTSDLHDEKMISLGRLAAGLAHELNNPASATVRAAGHLLGSLVEADAASLMLGAAQLPGGIIERIRQARLACLATEPSNVLSPIEQADREDAITAWLKAHGCDSAHAAPLAGSPVSFEVLDALAEATPAESLDAAVRWIAAGCTTHALARDIERAASRIHDLVRAVRQFTYMDQLAGPAQVDVVPGLRDTVRVLASKAKARGAAVTIEAEPDLPPVSANGGELNQVWLNLLDNALDAVPEEGRVEVRAVRDRDRVVVTIADNGPGIPDDVVHRIFDPFFTTKPPGQGTGLGLEITRRLVRRYHGDIQVESRPGRTEFRVTFPSGAQPAPEAEGSAG